MILNNKLSPEEKAQKRRLKKIAQKEKRERYNQELQDAADKMVCYHTNGTYTIYCPICKKRFEGSDYLKTVFVDEQALWLANMVTHYRHTHITSWNKCWGWGGYYYRQAAHFGDYDEEKAIVNERAKRQIARKCKDYVLLNNVNVDVFKSLQNTTKKTIEVVEKVFSRSTTPDIQFKGDARLSVA